MLGCLVPSSRNFVNWKADVLSIRKESVSGLRAWVIAARL